MPGGSPMRSPGSRATFSFMLLLALPGVGPVPGAPAPAPEGAEAPAPPPPAEKPLTIDLLADARFLFLTGFVSARENEVEGDRFYFRDLNADFAQNVGLSGRFSVTSRDRLELRIAYMNLRGSTSYDTEKVFNNTGLAAG